METRQKALAISEAEWSVMKVLWERQPLGSKDIVEALAGESEWKPKTIHTLIARLVRKGAVSATKEGREYRFAPAVREEECQRHLSRSFLDKVFDGNVAPFLACFVRNNKLSTEEIAELKRILDGKG